jgi:hypothetical protein
MITINRLTQVILVPVSFLTLVSGSLYELDVDALRLALKDIEDSPEGMSYVDTHRHNGELVLSGVTYARSVEIINGYTVEFDESILDRYTVRCVGANHNLADVKVLNTVSLIIGNSAGLIVGGSGTAPTASEVATAVWAHADASTLQARVELATKLLRNKTHTDPVTGIMTVYDDDGLSILFTAQMYEDVGGTQTYRGQGAERRERLA